MRVRPWTALAPLVVSLALAGGGLDAQTPAAAAPFLPQQHWAHDAIRRLGLAASPADVAVGGRRTLTRAEAARALEEAADAPGESGERARRALERFLAEFPLARRDGDAPPGAHASAAGGFEQAEGALRTGTGYGAYGIPSGPPRPLEDVSAPAVSARATAAGGRWWAVTAEAGRSGGDWDVESLQAVLRAGPVLLWGGRRPVGFGPGAGGGVLFGDGMRLDGGGVQLARPVRGPGPLRHLGAFHFETLLTRSGPSGQVENPWLWAARASIRPHPRLLLGINRGALFGGEGNAPTTLRDLAYIAVGKHAGGGSALENQLASVELQYHLPLPVATEAYVEWGLEDSSGAWKDVPGVLWGVAVAGLPGLGDARVGLEHAQFAGSCCGNPIWYRHMFLYAGWTEEGRPMGHPLGGHGEEWLVHGSAGLLDQALQLRASLAFRERRKENLYAPDRLGHSQAGRLGATYQAGGWQLEVEAASEAGAGWAESYLGVGARVGF